MSSRVHDLLNLLDPSLGLDAALGASRQGCRRTPGGQAVYVTTLPTLLVLTRPPSDIYLSPHCARKKCGLEWTNDWFPSLYSRSVAVPHLITLLHNDGEVDGCRLPSEIERERTTRVTSPARGLL